MPPARIYEPHIPAKPFADWLNDKSIEYDQTRGSHVTRGGRIPISGQELLAARLGWGDNDAGVRKLYRYRYRESIHEKRNQHLRWVGRADTWPRRIIENACHHYDPNLFYELYPELAHERDIALEPDAWCPFCKQLVTPVDGLCPWCVCEHGHLFREVGVSEDGFACLACLAAEQRSRDAANQRRRKEVAA